MTSKILRLARPRADDAAPAETAPLDEQAWAQMAAELVSFDQRQSSPQVSPESPKPASLADMARAPVGRKPLAFKSDT